MNRRKMLKLIGAAATMISPMMRGLPGMASESKSVSIPYRTLGRTGQKVSAIGIGGHHLGRAYVTEAESIEIVRTAVDSGVNFFDNSWDYNDGLSEIRLGRALRNGYRDKVFVMTKIDGRDKKTAARQLDESLQRLQTDRIDLLQFHEIIRMNDPDRIFAPGGAMEAVLEAKKSGKIRYIGFTGHKSPQIHVHMLNTAIARGFMFDTVQMPLNVMDAHYDSFEQIVLPVLVKHQLGILAMKTMGDGNILRSGVVTPVECLHYAMNLPVSVVITGCDSKIILEQALSAASSFRPMSDAQRNVLLSRTAKVAAGGGLELYKTTQTFDSTAAHPEWLG
jgi:predicted aldo/keto reductase-like oxidoreductase